MNEEILEAVKKALPSIQVDVLKKELDKAARFEILQKEHEATHKKNNELHNAITELREKEVEYNKVSELKRNYELVKTQHELECAKKSYSDVKELFYAALRNPEYRRTGFTPMAIPSGSYASCGSVDVKTEQT